MPLYMTQFSYTPEAWAALVKSPADRRGPIGKAAEGAGGRLLSLHYCFGEYDGVIFFEAPNSAAAARVIIAATAAGHLKAVRTTELFTMEEMLDILQSVGEPIQRPG